MEGGKMRMAAGKDLAESIERSAAQIDSIIKEHSPEAKMARLLKTEATKAQLGLYNEYKKMTPDQRAQAFEFKGGMLQYRDKYKNIMQGVRLTNALKQGQLLDKRLASGGGNPYSNRIRQIAAGAPVTEEALPSGPVTTNLSNPMGGSSEASDDAAALLNLDGVGEQDTDAVDSTDELD